MWVVGCGGGAVCGVAEGRWFVSAHSQLFVFFCAVVQAKDLRQYFVSDYRKLVGALPPAAEAGLDEEIWEEDDTVSGRVSEADVAFMLGTRNFNAFPVNVKVRGVFAWCMLPSVHELMRSSVV